LPCTNLLSPFRGPDSRPPLAMVPVPLDVIYDLEVQIQSELWRTVPPNDYFTEYRRPPGPIPFPSANSFLLSSNPNRLWQSLPFAWPHPSLTLFFGSPAGLRVGLPPRGLSIPPMHTFFSGGPEDPGFFCFPAIQLPCTSLP